MVCVQEAVVVAKISTPGPLDATTIKRGLTERDHKRCPGPKKIRDDVSQLFCNHCSGPLYFRGANGDMIAAAPGTATAIP